MRLGLKAIKMQLTEMLLQCSPLVYYAAGVTGLADRDYQSCGGEQNLIDECLTIASRGLGSAPLQISITLQLVKMRSASMNLGDR